MTNRTATIASLAALTMDISVHPVVDELSALSRLRPIAPTDEESYALLTYQTPCLADIATRGRHHAGEVERFLACAARTRDLALVNRSLPSLWATTLLNHSAAIAIALLPSAGPVDDAVRVAACQAVVDAALANGHTGEVPVIRAAFELDVGAASPAVALPPVMANDDAGATGSDTGIASAASTADGTLTLPVIEQAASLSAFMTASYDLHALMAEALVHFDHADRFAARLEDGERPLAQRDRLERAVFGAHILGVAALAQIGLTPVRGDDSRAIRLEAKALIRQRRLPDRLTAIVTLACSMGRAVREQIGAFERHGGRL